MKLITRNFLIWIGLFALAFFNGALREVGIKQLVNDRWAHHLSAFTAFLLFGTYLFTIWKKTGIRTLNEAKNVGVFWFILTILTETFVLNRWISQLTWEQVLQTYDITQGQLWPLVLIWVGLLPIVVRRLRGPAPKLG